MAYNQYYDLTPLERIRQANEEYRKVSMRNIINQTEQLEKANEPEYEGKVLVDDEGPDVSSELSVIDDNFRFLNANIKKLQIFIGNPKKVGAPLKPPKAPELPDPNDPKYNQGFKVNQRGVNNPTYKTDVTKYNRMYDDYIKVSLEVYAPTVNESFITSYGENITKNNYNLESIINNTKDILKIILEEGEQNFNFAQFNNTYKLFNNFFKEYVKFNNVFYVAPLPGYAKRNIFYLAAEYNKQDATGYDRAEIAYNLTEEFNDLCLEVIKLYEGIKKTSRERGTRKVQYEGAGRYRDQRVYHSAWM